jgi:hypothetical protein
VVSGRAEIIGAAALIEIEDWLCPLPEPCQKEHSCRERSQGDLPGKVPTSSADGLPIASPLTVAAWHNAQSTKRALHEKTLTVRFFRFISEVATSLRHLRQRHSDCI